ncbi:MAG: DNA repair protein RadC, partial [Bacilli bacterium]
MVKIKDMPINDRPRERLINNGSTSLSNEELLAIILKTGTKKQSVKELANSILSKLNNISNLKTMNYEQLNSIAGIGPSKATTILALIELTKRISNPIETINNTKFNNAKIVFEYYKDKIGDKFQEYFYCLYLNNKKIIIRDKLLYIGTINQTLIHPRDIFKEAYNLSASAIICIHNHPSGNPSPSKEDLEMTNNLINIGQLMGIKIADHIVISKNSY